MRNEKGLLVYDYEFHRRFMTPKEIALNDEFVKKRESSLTDTIAAKFQSKNTTA